MLQSPPYCFELVLARDWGKDATIKNSLVRHIKGSDGYIADISIHSSNVMMELGWVHFLWQERVVGLSVLTEKL